MDDDGSFAKEKTLGAIERKARLVLTVDSSFDRARATWRDRCMDILYYMDLMSQIVVVGPRREQNNQHTSSHCDFAGLPYSAGLVETFKCAVGLSNPIQQRVRMRVHD